MASFYKIINGIKYDRSILDTADELIKGQGDGRISRDDIKQLFQDTKDGPGITGTEYRTLDYIADNYNLTDAAREWLKDALKNEKPDFDSSGGKAAKKKGLPPWLKILLIILLIIIIIIIILCLVKKCTPENNTQMIKETNTSEVREETPPAVTEEENAPAGIMEKGTYTVKKGDRLMDIGHKFYGNNNDWILIYRANKAQIANEDVIEPGQIFKIPEK